MWSLEQVEEPGEPVVTLEEAKLHLRVEHDAEDSLIASYIAAATEHAEVYQLRSILERTWRLTLPRFPRGGRFIRLPRPPLQSVTSITYIDPDGAEQTMDSSAYLVMSDGRVLLAAEGWPRTASRQDAVRITYVAGYGEGGDAPQATRAAILLLVGHLYENRESVTVGTGPTFKLPMSTEYLLSPYRLFERDPLGGC